MAGIRDFSGKHAVVTGGSSGIGLATAELLASRGADVTIVARDVVRLEAASEAVASRRRAAGQHFGWVSADVATEAGALKAITEASAGGMRPIDLLVNAAGLIYPGYFESMAIEAFDECMESWRGCVFCSRAVVPEMISRGSGYIVNVSSVAGFMGVFGYTAYSSAKYAVIGFSEALRSEMRPLGITVSVVCPPDTDTPGLTFEKSLRPAETDKVAGNIKAIAPSVVAQEIVRGVERGRHMIIPGLISRFYRVLKGNAMWLFFAITDSDVAAARKARGA